MTRQKWIIFGTVFILIGVAGFYLHGWGQHQTIGKPGLKAIPIAGSSVMEIQLPEKVLDYTSEIIPPGETVTNMLPKDTSMLTRMYTNADGFKIQLSTVMMGKDRTSIHKPEYCLPGQGWKIEKREPMPLAMAGPPEYQLPAMKWTLSLPYKDKDGTMREARGFYVFWFTADNKLTDSHGQRLWWMMRDLLLTGILERWSYVSYFCYFPPEYEATAAVRLKQFIEQSAPEFQLPPKTGDANTVAR